MVFPVLAQAQAEDRPVLTFDAYRAVSKGQLSAEISNNNAANIPGLLNYLHTQVIIEHGLDTMKNGAPTESRVDRMSSISHLYRARFHVKNTDLVLTSPTVANVDFNAGVDFEFGEATTVAVAGLTYKWDYGDFVGVRQEAEKNYAADSPLFWYSFSGFCPNLKWQDKWLDYNHTVPNKKCVTYKDEGGYIKGGLCPKGTMPGAMPTGTQGCVYTYEPPRLKTNDVISLDQLVGITKEDCGGGRQCRDWIDWRKNCANSTYRRKFNYHETKAAQRRGRASVEATEVCVEYDIHPDCVDDCKSTACRKVPESQRELGLPFWRGRCDEAANRLRTEQVAAAFGVPMATTAHTLSFPEVQMIVPSCTALVSKEDTPNCIPNPNFGGPYCTRVWSNSCMQCKIPNTAEKYLAQGTPTTKLDNPPLCPFDILTTSDYVGSAKPECKSNAPRDFCCIYARSCNATISSDASFAPLDDDGFAFVASKKDTLQMETFLTRVIADAISPFATITDTAGFAQIAYNSWGLTPANIPRLDKIIKALWSVVTIPPTTTTTTGTTTLTTTATHTSYLVTKFNPTVIPESIGSPSDAEQAQSPHVTSDGSSKGAAPISVANAKSMPVWGWALIGAGSASLLGLAILGCYCSKASRKSARPARKRGVNLEEGDIATVPSGEGSPPAFPTSTYQPIYAAAPVTTRVVAAPIPLHSYGYANPTVYYHAGASYAPVHDVGPSHVHLAATP